MDFLSGGPRQRYFAHPSIRIGDLLAVRIYEALTGFRSGSSSELVPSTRENAQHLLSDPLDFGPCG